MFNNIIDDDFNMRCDIYETNDKYHIEIDLPGLKREYLKIDSNHGYWTVLATK